MLDVKRGEYATAILRNRTKRIDARGASA